MTAERDALADDAILNIAAREADELDATRVHEMRGNEWHATTIFDGDRALLRFARAVLAAQPGNDQSGREGNKAGTSAEQSTHGCKAPTQGEFAEYLAPDPTAAPAQGEPQGTHWDGCSTEGGPRHYDCAVAAIAALRAEVAKYQGLTAQNFDGAATALQRAERAEAERDALRETCRINMERITACANECEKLRADAERYRFWRKFYDCRFALKLAPMNLDLRAEGYAPPVTLSFMPTRPQVEIAKDYESLVDAAIDAARAGK